MWDTTHSRVLFLFSNLGHINYVEKWTDILLIYSFRSVVQGNHTLFREYSYIRKTPHNIASFIRVFWKCFRHIGRNGGIIINQNVVDTCIEIEGFWNTFIWSFLRKLWCLILLCLVEFIYNSVKCGRLSIKRFFPF